MPLHLVNSQLILHLKTLPWAPSQGGLLPSIQMASPLTRHGHYHSQLTCPLPPTCDLASWWQVPCQFQHSVPRIHLALGLVLTGTPQISTKGLRKLDQPLRRQLLNKGETTTSMHVCVSPQSLSRVQLSATPWTAARQVPLSMEFSRQACWSGLPFPSPGDLPQSGIEPVPPVLASRFFLPLHHILCSIPKVQSLSHSYHWNS